ncbi:MAG: hypothetical protein WAL83_10175 [Arenicellales bacterium]|jgi:hypothetical protein
MNKKFLIVPALGLSLAAAQPALAQGSIQHFSAAIHHSARAVSHAVVGSAELAATVVALPLKVSGAVGQVSGQAGDALLEIADQPIGQPLPLTDETVTAGPDPARAMQEKGGDQ